MPPDKRQKVSVVRFQPPNRDPVNDGESRGRKSHFERKLSSVGDKSGRKTRRNMLESLKVGAPHAFVMNVLAYSLEGTKVFFSCFSEYCVYSDGGSHTANVFHVSASSPLIANIMVKFGLS